MDTIGTNKIVCYREGGCPLVGGLLYIVPYFNVSDESDCSKRGDLFHLLHLKFHLSLCRMDFAPPTFEMPSSVVNKTVTVGKRFDSRTYTS